LLACCCAEAVTLPPSRGDGKETSISRAGIQLAVEGEIALLARLKVALAPTLRTLQAVSGHSPFHQLGNRSTAYAQQGG
jgi:hypothetical protein